MDHVQGLALGMTLKFCGKRVTTKSQKVFWDKPYVCTSYRRKTGRGPFAPPPHILKRFKRFKIISY